MNSILIFLFIKMVKYRLHLIFILFMIFVLLKGSRSCDSNQCLTNTGSCITPTAEMMIDSSGLCKCVNIKKCYESGGTNNCISPVSGKIGQGDGTECSSSACRDHNKCWLQQDFTCYNMKTTNNGLITINGGKCQCGSKKDCIDANAVSSGIYVSGVSCRKAFQDEVSLNDDTSLCLKKSIGVCPSTQCYLKYSNNICATYYHVPGFNGKECLRSRLIFLTKIVDGGVGAAFGSTYYQFALFHYSKDLTQRYNKPLIRAAKQAALLDAGVSNYLYYSIQTNFSSTPTIYNISSLLTDAGIIAKINSGYYDIDIRTNNTESSFAVYWGENDQVKNDIYNYYFISYKVRFFNNKADALAFYNTANFQPKAIFSPVGVIAREGPIIFNSVNYDPEDVFNGYLPIGLVI